MTIKKIWFDKDHIYGEDENGKSYNQSLLWYPKLLNATDDERNQYRFGFVGIHWRNLDEDIVLRALAMKMLSPVSFRSFFDA
jgi:hypothetical protein